jgi:phage shock protein A
MEKVTEAFEEVRSTNMLMRGAADDQIDNLHKELEKANDEVGRLEERVADLEDKIERLEMEMA